MDTNKLVDEAVQALDAAIAKDFSETEQQRVKEIIHDLRLERSAA